MTLPIEQQNCFSCKFWKGCFLRKDMEKSLNGKKLREWLKLLCNGWQVVDVLIDVKLKEKPA